jgi:hypothetical protein
VVILRQRGDVAISLRAQRMRVLFCWRLPLLANRLSKSCNVRKMREIGGVSCTSGRVVDGGDSWTAVSASDRMVHDGLNADTPAALGSSPEHRRQMSLVPTG